MRAGAFAKPAYVGGKVLFSLPQSSGLVRMSLYDMGGRFVRDVFNSNLGKGNYSVSVDTRGISSQFYLLRVTINGAATVLKLQPAMHNAGGAVVENTPEFQTRLEKLAAVVDTHSCNHAGLHHRRHADNRAVRTIRFQIDKEYHVERRHECLLGERVPGGDWRSYLRCPEQDQRRLAGQPDLLGP